MTTTTALVLLAAVTISSAVPIDVYGGVFGVDKGPFFGKKDYLRTVLGGDLGFRQFGKWNDINDIYSTIGDEFRKGVYDEVVPEVMRKLVGTGDLYDTLKKHQVGDLLDLNDKHTLQQVHLMQGQRLLRDIKTEQLAQILEDKEILNRLDLTKQVEIKRQLEKLDLLQWLQKMQLDQVHTIDDAKMTVYGYPEAYFTKTMKGIYGVGPFITGFGFGGFNKGIGFTGMNPFFGIRGGVF
ncbi:unnamed protein product [Acanthoscelides obtectus]|nr:unnamed protein product [Acanthoscelides obtectus]CAK1648694.1 hypothetical protein AOBTE_LOCUS15824 [Acanthoscelides obtectus]